MCGFSNFGSIGIQIASLSTLAPTKSRFFSKIAVKSMIAGNIGYLSTIIKLLNFNEALF